MYVMYVIVNKNRTIFTKRKIGKESERDVCSHLPSNDVDTNKSSHFFQLTNECKCIIVKIIMMMM